MTELSETAQILIYQTEDGKTNLEVQLRDETVWLSLAQLAELFQVDKSGVSRHLKNIFETGELSRAAVVANFATTAADGKTYKVDHYNLDMIISVGYRVKSHVATRFRQWATQRLREYIVKGFALDDQRLKLGGGGNYFDELLARIRDIRSTEKLFWRKVLDIYATSIDYDPQTEESRRFFAVIQNKMHWAAHGSTAAEIIHGRADAGKPHMGMTTWGGETPRRADAEVAKNYLDEQELDLLNRIVTMYLDFAELQALSRKPMYMADWIVKLDDFLKLSGREVLSHSGKVSHQDALEKAHAEYERYRREKLQESTRGERDFLEAAKQLEKKSKGD